MREFRQLKAHPKAADSLPRPAGERPEFDADNKTGMDLRAVLQRFEQEHQALAMMDHPNIAVVGCRLNVVEFRAHYQ